MADQENVPTPGTSDRKRKPDGYQLDASPKRLRQDISSGSPRSPLATQSQSRSNANHQHNHVEFPATPESTPEQTRKTPQSAELAPFKSMQDLRDTGLYVQEPDPSAPNSKYIAVAFGRIPGIYRTRRTASHQYNIRDGLHASFSTEDEALDFMNTYRSKVEESLQRHNEDKQKIKKDRTEAEAQMAKRTPSSSLSHTFSLPTPPSTQGSAYYDSSPGNNSVSGPGVQLSDEQKRVVKMIVDGENVFFTGSAGCGKSTVLKYFVPLLKAQGKVVQTIAPTNLAALAVGGRTLQSYAGWRPVNLSFTLDKLKADAHGTQQWKKFVEIDVLVIDEISMVPNHELERLNEVMKEARSALDPANRNRAFGGVQIVVTGDVSQL
ncbi:uncharacterized protein J4E84_003272 [Alternaria hordeiaustralica]|uniref:uncharacterized protein n=1 Tax=Alternaria hordeiaustralica TaxID=1187925 RepID=UPI0020C1F86E|nr:uncharacterized protein J4E84_003272 [Alternaria hordeiaustralica]KAI4692303.1 hypothetical protein J4E84_003272 [Alternaria hordeiaustralica]